MDIYRHVVANVQPTFLKRRQNNVGLSTYFQQNFNVVYQRLASTGLTVKAVALHMVDLPAASTTFRSRSALPTANLPKCEQPLVQYSIYQRICRTGTSNS